MRLGSTLAENPIWAQGGPEGVMSLPTLPVASFYADQNCRASLCPVSTVLPSQGVAEDRV